MIEGETALQYKTIKQSEINFCAPKDLNEAKNIITILMREKGKIFEENERLKQENKQLKSMLMKNYEDVESFAKRMINLIKKEVYEKQIS